MKLNSVNYGLFVFIAVLFKYISFINATNFERITYNQYIENSYPTPDYNLLTITWSNSVISAEDNSSNTWLYTKRLTDGVQTTSKPYNSNASFNVYANYLMEYNGILSDKNYVAWDITASCASKKITVSFKIKYFSCELPAITFYKSNTLTTSSVNKIRATDTQYAEHEGNITINNKSIPVYKLLGLGSDYSFITYCS